MTLAEKIVALRKKNGLSQEGLAEIAGVARQSVAKWETGESIPELDKLVRVADAFLVSLDSLARDRGPCAVPFDGPARALADRELVGFLRKAKRLTYAGHGAETAPSRTASHDLSYAEGSYAYYDTYLGGERFSGEEAVWKDGTPVWAMNYSGRVVHERFSGDFLKEALALVPEDEPYRGPRLYANGEYAYHMTVTGSFDWYSGSEEIFWGREKTYECLFHGGSVR